eukprot:1152641-Pelagomonas_calceolata.AAC.4
MVPPVLVQAATAAPPAPPAAAVPAPTKALMGFSPQTAPRMAVPVRMAAVAAAAAAAATVAQLGRAAERAR